MFTNLVGLTWFDLVTLTLTALFVGLIHLLNAGLSSGDSCKITKIKIATEGATNGILRKQQSEYSEDLSCTPPIRTSRPLSENGSQTPTTPSSPTTTNSSSNLSSSSSKRESISFSSNGSIQHPSSSDSLSDEYNEDEDTLSLENLFPCDQTEIYASKKISFIIDELIQTEANYVNNLRKGLINYGCLQEHKELPQSLRGEDKQAQLLGNIEEILQLHEQHILPLMLRNQRNLKGLFDEFAAYFDKNSFYCYVIFTMGKKTSMQLRQEQREWFQKYQTEIGDKLGIDSFLVQPIQRLTRYPLLLQQFISEFYKSGISCKPVLISVCKLETRMRRLLEVVNQSEEVPAIEDTNEFNVLDKGNFRRSSEFLAYHYRSRKKYNAKVFLFDRCLLCTEVRKKRLTYRQHYLWESVEVKLNSSKSVTLLHKSDGNSAKEEYEFTAHEAATLKQWLRIVQKIVHDARVEAAEKGFSLPTDLVVGVILAIWLIWNYL